MGANVKCVLMPSPNGLSQGLGWPVYTPYVVLGPMHSNATRTSPKYLREHNIAAITSVPSLEALCGELTSRSAPQIPCLKDRSYTVHQTHSLNGEGSDSSESRRVRQILAYHVIVSHYVCMDRPGRAPGDMSLNVAVQLPIT